MPLAPNAVMGASVTPALEGWFKNADGTSTILLGYSNRNQSQPFDIPIGPNNRIEPGGPDYGQPTHFLTGGSRNGRQYGVFSITVPKDFGTKKLTWTLIANGQPQTIAVWLPGGYMVAPFFRSDNGNSPPVVKFTPTGPELTGPPRGVGQTLTTTAAEPVTSDRARPRGGDEELSPGLAELTAPLEVPEQLARPLPAHPRKIRLLAAEPELVVAAEHVEQAVVVPQVPHEAVAAAAAVAAAVAAAAAPPSRSTGRSTVEQAR
jgi:hypothetical protein